jgi:hypothetical protein
MDNHRDSVISGEIPVNLTEIGTPPVTPRDLALSVFLPVLEVKDV